MTSTSRETGEMEDERMEQVDTDARPKPGGLSAAWESGSADENSLSNLKDHRRNEV